MKIWVRGDEDTNTIFGGKQQWNAFLDQTYSRSGNYIIPSCPHEYFHIQQTCPDLDFFFLHHNGSVASARACIVSGFCASRAQMPPPGSTGDLSVIKCWEGKVAGVWRADVSRVESRLTMHQAVEGGNLECSRGLDIMNSHCVFVPPPHSSLSGRCLVPYCPRHVLNSMWIVALLGPLTSLNSSGDGGQGHSPGLVFVVRWNVNSGWEKRGEVIMRRPPSAGCLFGQTGCLTAQAVDGILMDMTNDSLSPFSLSADSFLLDSLLSPLLLPSPSMRMKLSSLGFSYDSRDGCDMNTFLLFSFFFFLNARA